MAAITKEQLADLEKFYGLEPDGLSYQHRCSRITAYQKGEGDSWQPPDKQQRKITQEAFDNKHPLFGKRILITPLMIPDAKRALAYDEPIGPEIEVREYNAGEQIYNAAESVDRMVGDYEIIRTHKDRQVIAQTTFPKIGTEISWDISRELVPVVRGNDNKRGYIWSLPTQVIQVKDTLVQIYGLKTLISAVYPELLPKFSGKPMMSYIDGVTLAADIYQTEALLKEHRTKEMMEKKVGLQ